MRSVKFHVELNFSSSNRRRKFFCRRFKEFDKMDLAENIHGFLIGFRALFVEMAVVDKIPKTKPYPPHIGRTITPAEAEAIKLGEQMLQTGRLDGTFGKR